MKVAAIFCFVLCFALSILGQDGPTVVRGQVTDGNGNPLANAEVSIVSESDPTKLITYTDNLGKFTFSVRPVGRYTLTASYDVNGSLRSSTPTELKVEIGRSIGDINIQIGGVTTVRETVTISAGDNQPIEQVSKTVNVISGQEMRDRADFTLVESLRTIPGFRIQQLGGFGRTASIKTRGLRNQDTAILIDGIRFRDPSAITGDASPFLSDFTLTSVSRIEVLRGSGSSLYGTNAIGGAVDFRTPEAQKGTHGQLSGAFGGYGLGRFRGNISHGTDDDKFGIGAGFSRTAYTKGIDGQDNAGNTTFQARTDIRPFAKTSISGRVYVSDASVRLNVSPDTFGPLPTSNGVIINAEPGVTFLTDLNDPDSIQRSRFFSGQVTVDQVINSDLVIGGYYQWLSTRRKNNDGPLGPGFQSEYTSIFDGRIQTGNVNVKWSQTRYSDLSAGLEIESEKFGNEGSTPVGTDDFSTNAKQNSRTFYVQQLVSLFDRRLQLSGAFRSQWFSLTRPTFSSPNYPNRFDSIASPPASYTGDASVSYYFRDQGTKLRFHVGNGYRVPSLYERFGSYFFFGSFFGLGNPALKPERSTSLDFGVEQYLHKEKIKLTGTYFYTKINDEVTYLPTDDFGAPAYYNADKHFSRGIELSGTIRPTRSTDIFASYTFTNGDIRNFSRPTFPVGPLSSRDRKVFGVPDHQFTLVATKRFDKLWINVDLLATSSYLAPIFSNSTFSSYTYRFNGNRKADVTAGYTFGLKKETMKLRLYGTIENVFDNEYFENGFQTFGRTARLGLTLGF